MATTKSELKVRFQEPSIVVQRKEENDTRQRAQGTMVRLSSMRLAGQKITTAVRTSLDGVLQAFKEVKADITCFSSLPFEIREKIWEFAMPNRLITFAHPISNWTLTRDLSIIQHPQNVPFGHNGIKPAYKSFSLLRVCYESRLVALRHLHRTNNTRHALQPEDPTPRPTQFRRAGPKSDLRRPNRHDPFNFEADAALMPIRDTARGRSFRDPTVRHLLNTRHLVVEVDEAPLRRRWRSQYGTWRRSLAAWMPYAPFPEPGTWNVNLLAPVVPGEEYMLGHFTDLETVTFVFRRYCLRRARRNQPARVLGPRAYVVYPTDEEAGYKDQLRELYGREGPVATASDWSTPLPHCLDGVEVHPTARVRIGRVIDPDGWKEDVKEASRLLANIVWLGLRAPAFVLLSPFVWGPVVWDKCMFLTGSET
ncbi:hypothetical protein ACHAQH_002535 [Verticillium albo-atrum]